MVTVVALVVSSLAVVAGAAPTVVEAARTPAPIVSYHFSDGQGSTVADTSGSATPLDLTIADPASVTWLPGGLSVDAPTTIGSGTGSAQVVDAVQASGAVTFEAWIVPAATQTGPAHIVSNGAATGSNFMVGQGASGGLADDAYALRARTSTSIKGTPELVAPSGSAVPSVLTHVVSTRTADGVRTMYIDGAPVATDTLQGDLTNWDDTFALTVANDAEGASPWLGTLCLVAVYDTALDQTEVTNNFEAGCDVQASPPEALVEVTPGGLLDATTDGNATIIVSNTAPVGAPLITRVEFDVTGSIIPDATFDPVGAAGDETAQCLEVSDEGGTGYVAPVDNCADPFSLPHEDAAGVAGNGNDAMALDFVDFGPGESVVFGVDVDPTTIQGLSGAVDAGAISGLELAGSSVRVTFDDGSTLTNELFGDGSPGGSRAVLSPLVGRSTPASIEMLGVTTVPTVFPNDSVAGTVAGTGPQTIRVSGPAGASVTLLQATGALLSPTPFDPDPFESDAFTAVSYLPPALIAADSFVDIVVPIDDASVLHHFVATIDDGATGPLSQKLVVAVDGPSDPLIEEQVTEPVTEPVTEEPVVADDALAAPAIDPLAENVIDPLAENVAALDAVVLHRVNAGGPGLAATDGGPAWSQDQAGTPSLFFVSGTDATFATADVIDLSDPSVPAATPGALFQTERWDPVGGAELVYEFPVASGVSYAVDLYFAEIYATANNIREFAVNIEGVNVLDNYDIHELVGHDAGIVEAVISPVVADDYLTITFTHQVENPKISAIEVRPAGPPPTNVPPALGAIADVTMSVGGSLQIPIATTEPDGDVVTLSYSSVPGASSFTTFVDNGNGAGTITFDPLAGDAGVYDVTVTASDVDGTDTEAFKLTVQDPPADGTVFARINSGGPLVSATDGGPAWEADTAAANHPFLFAAGSNGASGSAAVQPGPSVPAYVPGAVVDTERWSASGFEYAVPVPAGTRVFVRLFMGNDYAPTSTAGTRVFDINIEGTLEDNFDIIPAFGNLTAGMKEYLVTSDGLVNIAFSNVVENPLVNAIEVVAADSSPNVLGANPIAVDFGATQVNGTQSQTVTLSNLGFEVTDPTINVTAVSPAGGEFTTNFAGPVSLLPGQSTQFDVTFAPTSIGAQAGSLMITHSGTSSPRFIALDGLGSNNIPVSFSASGLAGENLNNPTSLQFGPDGRLYVSQQDGEIKAYTVKRNGPNDYAVTATESINVVKVGTPNHNDDGSNNSTAIRQVTGLLVTGTPASPVLYVTSSDSRIAVGTDSGLDTNSGVISRLTRTGTVWDKVDIVRGLPRSEENHSTNGMDLDEASNTLYVMSGGHANKGAPGNNFSGTPEYYLSGALLTVDLDAIEALPVWTDLRHGNKFVYDLRTLDDPTRQNITKADPAFPYAPGHPLRDAQIDLGDPFGGNNSLNQAIPEPGGPVQIYSPGYRNAYDIVLTESDRLYTFDNGPNGGWGGQPLVYTAGSTPAWSATPQDPADPPKGPNGTGPFNQAAGDFCTNEFNESSSTGHGDALHLIDAPGYYGGHPAPIRAFPNLAGVIKYQNLGGWVATQKSNFYDLLPAGLTPANFPADPIQCEYSFTDSPKYLDVVNSSTNGITEYTATNFGGKMQGNIMAASFNGTIYSYDLNVAGDGVDQKTALFSGFGSEPLDVIAQGDSDPFPGTVWAATYGANNITVFEPADASSCTGANDPNLDEDNDGYNNADEIAAGTNPCSGGDKPTDNDNDGVSDFSDLDDDNDGIPDIVDEFALDPTNGLTTNIPVFRPLENNNPGTFFFGLGLSGLMTNGVTDYLNQFDPGNLAPGGNGGQLGIEEITAGDAFGANNDQYAAFQYGVNADTSTAPFVVTTEVLPPFFGGAVPVDDQSLGLQIGAGDQDNYLKLVVNANGGAGGIRLLKEVDGVPSDDQQFGVAEIGSDVLTTTAGVALSIVVDPAALTARAQAQVEGGPVVDLGTPVSIPAAWLNPADVNGLAVGVISTSINATPFDGLWTSLDVISLPDAPVADFTADVVSVAVGGSVSFTDESTNAPTEWLWSFEGGTPAASTVQNPVVGYDTPGVYEVSLTATNAGGSDTVTKTAFITVEAVGPVCAAGEWSVEWFDGMALAGAVAGSECVASIDMNFGAGGPVVAPSVGVDTFSGRFTKTVTLAAGTYEFTTRSDDGVRVLIDGTAVINKWVNQGATTWTGTRVLAAGEYTIVVEYFENAGGAVIQAGYRLLDGSPSG